MSKKKPSIKSVKKAHSSGTMITGCAFSNTVHFDQTSIGAVTAIAIALQKQADAANTLAKIFTNPVTPFDAFLKIEEVAQNKPEGL